MFDIAAARKCFGDQYAIDALSDFPAKVKRAYNVAKALKMLERAENGWANYVSMADKMAKIYAPIVHLLALAAFVLWFLILGYEWNISFNIAISVLIITCPCALGLAVPVTNVIAAHQLFKNGILMRDGTGLERAADINHVVFDKTGTLTFGTPRILPSQIANISDRSKAIIKALGVHSLHPASYALVKALDGIEPAKLEGIIEKPGLGLEAKSGKNVVRLGRGNWVGQICNQQNSDFDGHTFFGQTNEAIVSFKLIEQIRPDADSAIRTLKKNGFEVEILSGDGQNIVGEIAKLLNIKKWTAALMPSEKHDHLSRLKANNNLSFMVGDGLNDAPSLASAHVSMAPANACEVGRQTSDFIFTEDSLKAVPFTIAIARKAKRIIKQNFAIAIIYNCIAIPMAFMGMITPLIAALAMSASSIIVVLNSFRLSSFKMEQTEGWGSK